MVKMVKMVKVVKMVKMVRMVNQNGPDSQSLVISVTLLGNPQHLCSTPNLCRHQSRGTNLIDDSHCPICFKKAKTTCHL